MNQTTCFNLLSVNEYHQILQAMSNSVKRSTTSAIPRFYVDSSYSIDRVLKMTPNELLQMAKDPNGSKFIQENLSSTSPLRKKVFAIVLENDLLVPLAKDNFANFVIQVINIQYVPMKDD